MRSAGFILDCDGNVKRTWVYQNDEDGYEQAPIPVEKGDEVVVLDLGHPKALREPQLVYCRTRQDILTRYPEEMRTHRYCDFPADNKTRRVSPRLTMFRQRADESEEHEEIEESQNELKLSPVLLDVLRSNEQP